MLQKLFSIRLSQNQDHTIRYAVANQQNAPIALLEKLIKDNDKKVRQAAVRTYLKKYPQGLPKILIAYSQNSRPEIAILLTLLHPQIPSEILTKKSRAQNWLERYAVAINPNTSIEIEQKLTNDSNLIVRHAALA